MLCFSVDSRDSLENVESKWVGEIAENCAGVKLVLVALKCDLRESGADEDDEATAAAAALAAVGSTGSAAKEGARPKDMIDYKTGLEVAKRIQALRYLGTAHSLCSWSSLFSCVEKEKNHLSCLRVRRSSEKIICLFCIVYPSYPVLY